MNTLAWYDNYAPVYDLATLGDVFYRKSRIEAIAKLKLTRGARVADVFCGTGVNFPLLADQIGADGAILALDGSGKMLAKAQARAARDATGAQFTCVQADLTDPVGLESAARAIAEHRCHHILFSLGLTCLPNWREVSSRLFDAAPSGVRVVIMDAYSARLRPGARFINWIGAADIRRPAWQGLEDRAVDFAFEDSRPFGVIDVSLYVASGSKP